MISAPAYIVRVNPTSGESPSYEVNIDRTPDDCDAEIFVLTYEVHSSHEHELVNKTNQYMRAVGIVSLQEGVKCYGAMNPERF